VTPEDAYEWSGGRILHASRQRRTDAPPLKLSDGRLMRPSSVNTAYIFGAVGMAIQVSRATRLRDEMFLVAAEKLASLVRETPLEHFGGVLPPPLFYYFYLFYFILFFKVCLFARRCFLSLLQSSPTS
jgi:malic enzyme